MKALLAIAWREVRLRAAILPGVLVVGFLPIIAVVAFPSLRWHEPWSILMGKDASAPLTLGLTLVAITGLSTGWTVIGSELTNGRLGFLFSRPVPWWAIWAGKLSASVVLTASAGLLAALPWIATSYGDWRSLMVTSLDVQGWVSLVAILFLAVGLANAVSLAYRSRPIQRALDLVLLGAWLGALWTASRLVMLGWSMVDARIYTLMPVPLALALIAASAAAVFAGRMDPNRGHTALSLTLWPLLFGGLGSLIGLGCWMDSVSPFDLQRVAWAAAAPQGDWIWIAGPVRWRPYWVGFFYQASSGRFIRYGTVREERAPLAFSEDGRKAALIARDPFEIVDFSLDGRVRVVDLAAEKPVPHTVPCSFWGAQTEGGWPPGVPGWNMETLACRPNGDGLFASGSFHVWLCRLPAGNNTPLVGASLGSVRPLGDGRLLAFVTVFPDRASWFNHDWLIRHVEAFGFRWFLYSGVFGVWFDANLSETLIVKIDPRRAPEHFDLHGERVAYEASSWWHVTGVLPWGGSRPARLNRTGDRLLRSFKRFDRSPWLVTLHDSETGDSLATLAEGVDTVNADFLSDGRIALGEVREAVASLRLLGPDGRVERRIDLGQARSVLLGSELAPGRLLIGLRHEAPERTDYFLIDLETGAVVPEPGLLPVTPVSEEAQRPEAGSLGTRLFFDQGGTLVRLDPDTGTRTPLLGRAGR